MEVSSDICANVNDCEGQQRTGPTYYSDYSILQIQNTSKCIS